MAAEDEQQPLLGGGGQAAMDEDEGTFVSVEAAGEEEAEQQTQRATADDDAASTSSRLAPPAPSLPPPSPPPTPAAPGGLAAAAASALPAALSQTAVADLLKHLPEQVQRVAGTTEGLALLCVSALLFALAVAALLRALFGGSSSSRRRRQAAPRHGGPLVLLAGPSNAGKTAIFMRLRDGGKAAAAAAGLAPTVASMAPNMAAARVSSGGGGRARAVTLLDVPGHASHRTRLEAALADAAGVVFVVDSADVSPHRTATADAMWDVLASADFARRRLPLLIACNKSDLELDAHSADFVRKTLERQLDAMRKTRTAGIGRTAGAAAGGELVLGVPADRPCSFAAMAPRHRVSLAEVSAALEGKLAEVEAFAAGL
jgi:signal recognition particle receptor subunit beta